MHSQVTIIFMQNNDYITFN